MKRVEHDEQWSLFCPSDAPALPNLYGEEFNSLYELYEMSGLARETIQARVLWKAILDTQIETGGPFMLYKDAINGTCEYYPSKNHN